MGATALGHTPGRAQVQFLPQLQGILVQNPPGCCIPGSSFQQAGVSLPLLFPAWAACRELPGGKGGVLPIQAARQEWEEARERHGEVRSPCLVTGAMGPCGQRGTARVPSPPARLGRKCGPMLRWWMCHPKPAAPQSPAPCRRHRAGNAGRAGMEGMLKAAPPHTQGKPRSHPHLKPRRCCFPKASHPLIVPKSQPFRSSSSSSGAVAAPRALPAHSPVSPGTFVVSTFVFSASRRQLEKQHSLVFSQYFLPPRDLRSYKWTKTCVILTSEDFKSQQKNMFIVKKA